MRKNSQLLIAYTLLLTSAIGAVCYDSHIRSKYIPALSEAEQKAAERRAKGTSVSRVVSAPAPAVAPAGDGESKNGATQLPRGIFFTKETMTLESSEGKSREISAGSQVVLVRRDHGKMKVHLEGSDYLVDEEQLTRNIRAVEKLAALRKR